MTWLWILLIAIVVGGIIGYMTSGSKEGAKRGAASFGIGCGYILMHIFFAFIGLYILFKLGEWLFF